MSTRNRQYISVGNTPKNHNQYLSKIILKAAM